MDIRPGDIIYGLNNSKFSVVDIIGSGSFGIVYEVHDKSGKKFALKTLITALLKLNSLKALINEGKQMVELKDDNVLEVIFFHHGNQYPNLPPYIIMEYAENGTLQDYISNRKADNKLFTLVELKEIYLQLANGMKAINNRLVHRDIKPDNILISNNLFKIADFGLSKIAGAATRSNTFKGINHIRYCAPEAWLQEDNTIAMDIYSMGIVFYELATLKHPYDVNDTGDIFGMWKRAHLLEVPSFPENFNTNIDIKLSQMIMKMLSKKPSDRYSSWDSIINTIEQAADTTTTVNSSIKNLVKIANTNFHKAEQDKLKQHEEQVKIEEYIELIRFSVREIRESLVKMVEEFNSTSENVKITVTNFTEKRQQMINNQFSRPNFEFIIYSSNNINRAINISIIPVLEKINIDNKTIKAWGYAKAPSGKGFNFLLLADNDDIYGNWMVLFNLHSTIAIKKDNRPDPFPFEYAELPKEITYINSMHIYNTTIVEYKPTNFAQLIEEIL